MSNQKFDEMYKGNNTKELTALAKELGVPRYTRKWWSVSAYPPQPWKRKALTAPLQQGILPVA